MGEPPRAGAVVPRSPSPRGWPTLIQRTESGLIAALPLVALAALVAFGRFGPSGAEVTAVVALVGLWVAFFARPRAAWIATRGAVGALLGAAAFVLLGFLLPSGTPVFSSFILLSLSVAAAYLAGIVLALRDVPTRRPWLRQPGIQE
jgi:hypothetical protein